MQTFHFLSAEFLFLSEEFQFFLAGNLYFLSMEFAFSEREILEAVNRGILSAKRLCPYENSCQWTRDS